MDQPLLRVGHMKYYLNSFNTPTKKSRHVKVGSHNLQNHITIGVTNAHAVYWSVNMVKLLTC